MADVRYHRLAEVGWYRPPACRNVNSEQGLSCPRRHENPQFLRVPDTRHIKNFYRTVTFKSLAVLYPRGEFLRATAALRGLSL